MSPADLAFAAALLAAEPQPGPRCGAQKTAALLGRGEALQHAGKWDEAMQVLATAIPAGCDEPAVFRRRTDSYMRIPLDPPRADRIDNQLIADYRRVLELQPGDLFARSNLAFILQRHGRHHEVATELQTLLHQKGPVEYDDPRHNPQNWADCADALDKIGDTDTGLAMLNEYFASFEIKVTLHRNSVMDPHRVMATLLMKTGRVKEALAHAKKAARNEEAQPDDLKVYVWVLEAAGQRTEALAEAKRLARWEGKNVSAETKALIARLQRH